MWFLWSRNLQKPQNCIFLSSLFFESVHYKNAYIFDQEWYFFIIPFLAVTGLNCPDKKFADFRLGLQNFSANFLAKICRTIAIKFWRPNKKSAKFIVASFEICRAAVCVCVWERERDSVYVVAPFLWTLWRDLPWQITNDWTIVLKHLQKDLWKILFVVKVVSVFVTCTFANREPR